jgi:hypothetical protein
MTEDEKNNDQKYKILILKGWYIFLGIYFSLLFYFIYIFNFTESYILIDSLFYFSICVLIFSITASGIIPYIFRENFIILKSLALIRAIFYGFLLIFGSIYLTFYVSTGPIVINIEILIVINLLIVSFTSYFEFYFLWEHILKQTISVKEISKIHTLYLLLVFSSCSVFLYYLSQSNLVSINSIIVLILFFNLIAGDAFIGVQIERLNKYWSKLNEIKNSSSEINSENNKSILFSQKFYRNIIIPIYLILTFLIAIPVIYQSSIISPYMREFINIIIMIKSFLIVFFFYLYFKRGKKYSRA